MGLLSIILFIFFSLILASIKVIDVCRHGDKESTSLEDEKPFVGINVFGQGSEDEMKGETYNITIQCPNCRSEVYAAVKKGHSIFEHPVECEECGCAVNLSTNCNCGDDDYHQCTFVVAKDCQNCETPFKELSAKFCSNCGVKRVVKYYDDDFA